ncbi:MAG TPA: cell wall hydrolase, partial [Xanthobacteraceae bacterium]|nr:cell wall hydrolase [Xanthobacteraceae bacterium]
MAPVGLAVLFALAPNVIGYQDLGALIAQQPAVAAHWREHLIASPFGTIHAARFSLPRPVGTAVPVPARYQPVRLDGGDIVGSMDDASYFRTRWSVDASAIFPSVDRATKGDILEPRENPERSEPTTATTE